MFDRQKFIQTLIFIQERLSRLPAEFYGFNGSCVLTFFDESTTPRDIDMICEDKYFDNIYQVLKDYSTNKPHQEKSKVSIFRRVEFDINGFEVDLIGENKKLNYSNLKITEDKKVPIYDLSEIKEMYQILDKQDKVFLLDKIIKQHVTS